MAYLSVMNKIVNNMLEKYIKKGYQKWQMPIAAGDPLLSH